jgi:hypothetical protein
MDELALPFVRLWTWITQVGGFPGQLFFILAVIMAVIGLCTWIGNKR